MRRRLLLFLRIALCLCIGLVSLPFSYNALALSAGIRF